MKKILSLLLLVTLSFTAFASSEEEPENSTHKVVYQSDNPSFSPQEALAYFSGLNLIKRSSLTLKKANKSYENFMNQ